MRTSNQFGQWRFFWGMLFFASASCLGAETWMPDTRHLQAFEQGETCSIYQSLQRRAQLKLTEVVSERDQYDTSLRRRRALLEACAKNAGVVSFVSDQDEAQLAQLCGEDYAAWMNLGFRMRVVREDIRAVKANLKWLRGRMTQCAPVKPPGRRVAALTPPSGSQSEVRSDSVDLPSAPVPPTASPSAFKGATEPPLPTQVPVPAAAAPAPTVSPSIVEPPPTTFAHSARFVPE